MPRRTARRWGRGAGGGVWGAGTRRRGHYGPAGRGRAVSEVVRGRTRWARRDRTDAEAPGVAVGRCTPPGTATPPVGTPGSGGTGVASRPVRAADGARATSTAGVLRARGRDGLRTRRLRHRPPPGGGRPQRRGDRPGPRGLPAARPRLRRPPGDRPRLRPPDAPRRRRRLRGRL